MSTYRERKSMQKYIAPNSGFHATFLGKWPRYVYLNFTIQR